MIRPRRFRRCTRVLENGTHTGMAAMVPVVGFGWFRGFASLRRLVRRARDRIGQDRVEDVGVGRAVVHEVHRSRNPPTAPERLNVAPPHRAFPDVIRRITSETTGALMPIGSLWGSRRAVRLAARRRM